MPKSITIPQFNAALSVSDTNRILLDVRKVAARKNSGLTMIGAHFRRPFAAENWWQDFEGKKLIVFCVHGHEVSQGVCGFLNDCGLDAIYLEGGFEAYRAAGGDVIAIGDDNE